MKLSYQLKIALITSTIAPLSNAHALVVVDPKQRLQEYKHAFGFYCDALLQGTFDRIVYVDNSGHSLEEIKIISQAKGISNLVEFISYTSNLDVKYNSRFFLEINLINHFFQNSTFIKSYSDSIVWKLTGRYYIKNIFKLLNSMNDFGEVDLFINYRNCPYKVVDFYLVGFTTKCFQSLFASNLNLYRGARDGELILREYLDSASAKNLKTIKRFPITPRIYGTRGWDGSNYGGLKDSSKYYIRSIINKAIPILWI